MDIQVALTADEMIKGLKHYRRIAKQDLLRATQMTRPEFYEQIARTRRSVYAQLAEIADMEGPAAAVQTALDFYRKLPFVTGTPEGEYPEIKGRESALENFFKMVALEPKVRRSVRSQRPSLKNLVMVPAAA